MLLVSLAEENKCWMCETVQDVYQLYSNIYVYLFLWEKCLQLPETIYNVLFNVIKHLRVTLCLQIESNNV